jgi:DNA gyrase subunit A
MEIGKLLQTNITQEMKKSYLNYAMSVIVSRALPDVRDGLKPVHRRILYAMHKMGLVHTAKYLKSAKVVGEVMGNYHPHGDMPIYDALVRLAQDFSMRYPLVDGQGNFGSIDGDPPAAMRYTESRMAAIAAEMLIDIEKETVDFIPTFDSTTDEPVYLPAKLPNLLLMGSEGIAVGMATKIPPHNLGEVIDAIQYLIGKTKIITPATQLESTNAQKTETKETEIQVLKSQDVQLQNNVTIDDLLQFIQGPDFPTAGAIYDHTEIKNAYITGRGKIIIRGKAEIEEIGNGKSAITVTEIPYQVNKAQLIAKIADLAKEKKIEGISDLRDESDRRGMHIYIELKRDASPKKVLNNLFKHTALQTSFPVNMVALVNGTPQTLNLKLIVEEYLKHRYLVIRKRSEFELKQAKARLHILEGLKIAIDFIDAVIATIRASKTQEEAKTNLIAKFKLSEIQAAAILDMQLRRLAALERQKIEDEISMVKETIAYLEDLLAHGEKILSVIKTELQKIKEKYADPRRTKVFKGKVGEFSEEDLIPNEPTVITLTNTGYIKRQSLNSFHTQNRGGKGITGMNVKDEDGIANIRYAQTHDNILFFTNKGKAYQLKAYEISESSRTSKGTAIVNLLNLEAGEKVQSFVVYSKTAKNEYIFLTTRNGTVKKTALTEFENIRRNGMIAIKLDAGDELVWSNMTDSKNEIIIVTKAGKAIRFKEEDVRPLGRAAMGVRGIKIDKSDQVIGMDAICLEDKPVMVIIMENGLGKKTPIDQFPLQGRGGQGVKVAKVTPRTGNVAVAEVLPNNCEEIIITSTRGQIVKLAVTSIPKLSRDTQGVILMRFSNAADKVASATSIEQTVIGEEKEKPKV